MAIEWILLLYVMVMKLVVVPAPGGQVVYIGESRLPFGQEPLLLYGGGLTLQTSSGSVQAILLDTHIFMSNEAPTTLEQVRNTVIPTLCVSSAEVWLE